MKLKNIWKKMMGLGLVAMLSATALVGCSSETTTGSKENETKKTEEQASESTLDKIKERGKFVVGVKYDLNLFGLKNPQTGEVEGFDIDIAKGLAKKILGDENKSMIPPLSIF